MNINVHPGYIWLWIGAALASITALMNGGWQGSLIPFVVAAGITALVQAMENV